MTKKVLTIFLTTLLFLSAITLGCANVFRIDNVAMVATVVSDESKDSVAQLKDELYSFYKNKSIFSAKQKDVKNILEQYPYFRVVEFEKVYPNEVVVTIEEEAEVYAVEKSEGEYYILGETGAVLEIRSSQKNRLDKADNVDASIDSIIANVYTSHKRIIFNGNNYSKAWVEEAQRRGLLNLSNTAMALPHYLDSKNIALLGKHGILNEKEIKIIEVNKVN